MKSQLLSYGFTRGGPALLQLRIPEGRIACRLWLPACAPRAAVLHLHGIESHSGWFTETGDALAKNGYCVIAADRWGSGLSGGARGSATCWTMWRKHAIALAEQLKSICPDAPFFVAGSCWGAKVATAVALHRPELVTGLILLAPAFKLRVRLPLADLCRLFVALLCKREDLLSVPIPREEMFTREEPYLSRIRNDKLRITRVTAPFFRESWRLDRALSRELTQLALPTIVILAGHDLIVDNRRVVRFLKRGPRCNLQIVTVASASHSMEFGANCHRITSELCGWIDAVLKCSLELQPIRERT